MKTLTNLPMTGIEDIDKQVLIQADLLEPFKIDGKPRPLWFYLSKQLSTKDYETLMSYYLSEKSLAQLIKESPLRFGLVEANVKKNIIQAFVYQFIKSKIHLDQVEQVLKDAAITQTWKLEALRIFKEELDKAKQEVS